MTQMKHKASESPSSQYQISWTTANHNHTDVLTGSEAVADVDLRLGFLCSPHQWIRKGWVEACLLNVCDCFLSILEKGQQNLATQRWQHSGATSKGCRGGSSCRQRCCECERSVEFRTVPLSRNNAERERTAQRLMLPGKIGILSAPNLYGNYLYSSGSIKSKERLWPSFAEKVCYMIHDTPLKPAKRLIFIDLCRSLISLRWGKVWRMKVCRLTLWQRCLTVPPLRVNDFSDVYCLQFTGFKEVRCSVDFTPNTFG